MRIIAGRLGGRTIYPPLKKWPTRPTTDRTREALFNILDNEVIWENAKVLDLFGGTGLISFEMISRGVEAVDYVEKYPAAISFVKQAAKDLDVEDQINIIQSDVFKFLERIDRQYSLIFADPPYQMFGVRDLPDRIFSNDLLIEGGILIIEHDASVNYRENLHFRDQRSYGQTYLSFFKS